MGKTPARDNPSYWGEGNIWVSIADMKDVKYISSSKEQITDIAVRESGIKPVKKGAAIMSFKLSIGKAAIANTDLYTNEAIMSFSVKNGHRIKPEFIYYFLKGFKWAGANKAVMGLTLNKKTIASNFFSYPPIAEQERIVAELDCLTGIIEKKKQQLKELDNLAQAIFYDMFGDPITNEKGWEVKTMGNLTVLFNGRAFKPNDWSETGLPIVRIQNLNDPLAPYNFYNGQTEEKYLLHGGELLYAWSGTPGTSFGAHIWDGQEAVLNQHIFKIEFNQSLLNKSYFLFHLNSSVRHLFDFTHGGVGLKHITKGTLTSQIVPLPPIDKQNTFAQKIEAIDQQKELIKKSIQETEMLFNSRMDYWFN